MRNQFFVRRLILGLIVLCNFGWFVGGLAAAEPYKEFLRGLRRRRMHNQALQYIDYLKTSRLVSQKVKNSLPFERAITLFHGATLDTNVTTQAKKFDEAISLLKKYAASPSGKAQGSSVLNSYGNLLRKRADSLREKADGSFDPAAAKQLQEQARTYLTQAEAVYGKLKKQLAEEIKAFKKDHPQVDKRKKDLYAQREKLRNDYTAARLRIATVEYEIGLTHPPGSKERITQLYLAAEGRATIDKKTVESDKDNFEDLFEKYSSRLLGYHARFRQGKCYQAMGPKYYEFATAMYDECHGLPDSHPVVRAFKAQVYTKSVEIWIDDKEPNYGKIQNVAREWLDKAKQSDKTVSDFLGLRLIIARADWSYVSHLKKEKKKVNQRPRLQKKYTLDAVQDAGFVAKYPSTYQQAAKILELEIRTISELETEEPKTFSEAVQRARDLSAITKSTEDLIVKLENRLKKDLSLTGEEKKAISEEITKARESTKEISKKISDYYQKAISLSDETTDPDEMYSILDGICYRYWKLDKFLEAAILGEYLARLDPSHPRFSMNAKTAMYSWSRRYKMRAENDRGDFETDRIVRLARLISENAPDQSEQGKANIRLAGLLAFKGKPYEAKNYADKVSTQSAALAKAHFSVGRALRNRFLSARIELASLQKYADDSGDASVGGIEQMLREQFSELFTQVKPHLETELTATSEQFRDSLKKFVDYQGKPDQLINDKAKGALWLAQSHISNNQFTEAISYLENATFGPLTVAASTNPPDEEFAVRAYTTALQAYLGAQDQKNAEAMIKVLSRKLSGEQLLSAYRQMLISLDGQYRKAPTRQKKILATAIANILTKMSQTKTDNPYRKMVTVFVRFGNLGRDFESDPQASGAFYREAVKAGKILQESNPPRDKVNKIRLLLGIAHSAVGNHDEAEENFKLYVQGNNSFSQVQVRAAENFQSWGAEDPANYMKAIQGGGDLNTQTEKWSLWGWKRIASFTGNSKNFKRFKDDYLHAQYMMATCYFEYGKAMGKKDDADQEKKYIGYASTIIRRTKLRSKDYGGENQAKKFDALKKKIGDAS